MHDLARWVFTEKPPLVATKLRGTRAAHRTQDERELAGSHRATRPRQASRVSKRAVIVAAVVALVPAAVYGVHSTFGGSDSSGGHRPPSALPIPPVTTPASTPSSATTVPTTPVQTPTAPVVSPPKQPNLPRVAVDVPRRLLSSGLLNVGFDDSVEPTDGTFRARSTAEVARWGSRGEPGSPAKDTVYVIGKSYTKGVSAFDTLPRIRAGAKIVIRTDSGDLTYTVTSVATEPSAGLARTQLFTAKVPGRLVVVGLGYDRSGSLTGKAVVVVAEISGATAR
jgi:hypothetical protein